jgi:hypothetical protein
MQYSQRFKSFSNPTLIPKLRFAMSSSSPQSTTAKGLPFPEIQPPTNGKAEFDANGKLLSVPSKFNYVTHESQDMHVYRDLTGCDSGIQGAEWDPVQVPVRNARGTGATLDEQGFELRDYPVKEMDFMDTQMVIDEYYPECEKLIQQALGPKAKVVKAFDHNVRISATTFGAELKGGGGRAQVPVGMVHGDYTKVSGPKRLDDLAKAPKENDVLKSRQGETPLLDPVLVQEAQQGKRRFALMNVWRSIDPQNPVQQFPLACVDMKTAPSDGLKTFFIHYADRVGENYFSSHNERHEWSYFPQMTYNEAMLIKQWDSFGALARDQPDGGRSTFAIHSAFSDPTSPKDAPPRKSIEVRVAIVWEEGEE